MEEGGRVPAAVQPGAGHVRGLRFAGWSEDHVAPVL